jgi:hypothetical protein
VVWAFAGFKGMKDVWPAILVTGVSFAVPQFVISNYTLTHWEAENPLAMDRFLDSFGG